jgi:hypothetical protein
MATEDDSAMVADLVAHLAETQGSASLGDAGRIRARYAERGLSGTVNARVIDKHRQHIEERSEWPSDTSVDDYLESLRATVADEDTSIYVTFEPDLGDWVVYFVGRIRRAWRGPRAGQRMVVLFRREPPRWITGFQARDGDGYVDSQGGHWIYRPR